MNPQSIGEVVLLCKHNLLTHDEARELLGYTSDAPNGSLAEAERVLRVISGWNPDRVTTADAIKPAIDYFDKLEEAK